MELSPLRNLQSATFKLLQPANSKQQTANSKQQPTTLNQNPHTVLVNQIIRLRGIGCRVSDGVAASAVTEGSVFDLSLAPAALNDKRDSASFFNLYHACVGYKVVECAAVGCQHPKVSKAETPNRKRRDNVSKQCCSWVEQLARF